MTLSSEEKASIDNFWDTEVDGLAICVVNLVSWKWKGLGHTLTQNLTVDYIPTPYVNSSKKVFYRDETKRYEV